MGWIGPTSIPFFFFVWNGFVDKNGRAGMEYIPFCLNEICIQTLPLTYQ